MMGMTHANDVRYDAYLANDRTLDDPDVVRVDTSGRVRLRIVNGGTATAFFVSTPGLPSSCVAVDGAPCKRISAGQYPLAQGQRIDLLVEIPAQGGAFPVLAQVEAARFVTGVVLATPAAAVRRLDALASRQLAMLDLSFETKLQASEPLAVRRPDQAFMVMLGEEPGYRWTLNGRVHGEHRPFAVKQGQRIEMTFMNPTSMMHPMHLHGHRFQVVGIGGRRWQGPMRDTVIVPAHAPVTIAFDANHKGSWFLHCHHLYHMATGMMTEVSVS
jgi:FtsP/CotA-like multicopper oxidase with cupredoxin domain